VDRQYGDRVDAFVRLDEFVPDAVIVEVESCAKSQASAASSTPARGRSSPLNRTATGSSTSFRGDDGQVSDRLLTAEQAASVSVASGRRWTFDADGAAFRLASEARRIQLAHLFDPFAAVGSSTIQPLLHQIDAVYGRLLPLQPLKFLLADDPGDGLGETAGDSGTRRSCLSSVTGASKSAALNGVSLDFASTVRNQFDADGIPSKDGNTRALARRSDRPRS
jgi:hypothetical protein